MQIQYSNAFDKIRGLVNASLQKMDNISKPQFKFLLTVFELWLGLPVRYTMLNVSGFCTYSEKSIRLHFEKFFDFVPFNALLIKKECGQELIAAFDPTYLAKSGKKTPGLAKWWCGTYQRALKGLEISCLSVVDVQAETAMTLEAVQTPAKAVLQESDDNLISHYVSVIKKRMAVLKGMTKCLVADGYFMKDSFIAPLLGEGLDVITKMRSDANLRYLYNGPKRTGKGRPKRYDGKVACQSIDKRRIRIFYQDEEFSCYSGVVYAMALKLKVRIVYIEQNKTGRYQILMSTDLELDPELIMKYYRLRFQIEFLILRC